MIKDRLLNLPGEIEELKIKLYETQVKLGNYKERLKSWELIEMSRIANEVDDNGKAKYSNDAKRQAELLHRISESEEYGSLDYEAAELEDNVTLLNISIEKLFNEQGNLRAICRLEGALNE